MSGKIHIILALAIIMNLFSCSKDEPQVIGNIDYKIDVSGLTSTSVIVQFTIPQDNNLIKEGEDYGSKYSLYIGDSSLDKPIFGSNDFYNYMHNMYWYNNREDRTEVSLIEESKVGNEVILTYLVGNLEPEKTYYVILRTPMDLSGKGDNYYETCYLYTGYSFTTAEKMDTSVFTKGISSSIYSSYEYATIVKVNLPKNLHSGKEISISASLSPDITNPIIGEMLGIYFDGYEDDGYKQKEAYYFIFPALKEGKYYFQFKGDFNYVLKNEYASEYDINLGEFTVKSKSLDVEYSNVDITYEVNQLSENETELVVKLPGDWYCYDSSELYLSANSDMSSSVNSKGEEKWGYNGRYLSFTFQDLKKGKYYARIKGDFNVNEYNPDSGSYMSFELRDVEFSLPGLIEI